MTEAATFLQYLQKPQIKFQKWHTFGVQLKVLTMSCLFNYSLLVIGLWAFNLLSGYCLPFLCHQCLLSAASEYSKIQLKGEKERDKEEEESRNRKYRNRNFAVIISISHCRPWITIMWLEPVMVIHLECDRIWNRNNGIWRRRIDM